MVGYQFNSDAKRTVSISLYSKKVDCLLINQAELTTLQQPRQTPSPQKLIGGGAKPLTPISSVHCDF